MPIARGRRVRARWGILFRRTVDGWEKVVVRAGLENGTSVAVESGLRGGCGGFAAVW
jgi:hypothetical protein